MIINDIVWGKDNISDKEVLKIVKHAAFQRIKKVYISTYGYLFDFKRNSTRYEHCWGVYKLLKHFNASKEEQIAGLIHDISHTAFSHVSTYFFLKKWTGREFHEEKHRKIVKESGLWEVLEKLGFDVEYLLNEKNFSLLENDLPDICADRLDYTIRDGLHLQLISKQQANKIIDGLKVFKNKGKKEFVFKNIESAEIYSEVYYQLNLCYYGSPMEAYFNHKLGDIVGKAIKEKVIKEEDWFGNDEEVIEKIKKSGNKKLIESLKIIDNRTVVYEDVENPMLTLSKKIRIVDPKILIKGELKRLSEVSSSYKKKIEEYTKTHSNHELNISVLKKK